MFLWRIRLGTHSKTYQCLSLHIHFKSCFTAAVTSSLSPFQFPWWFCLFCYILLHGNVIIIRSISLNRGEKKWMRCKIPTEVITTPGFTETYELNSDKRPVNHVILLFSSSADNWTLYREYDVRNAIRLKQKKKVLGHEASVSVLELFFFSLQFFFVCVCAYRFLLLFWKLQHTKREPFNNLTTSIFYRDCTRK